MNPFANLLMMLLSKLEILKVIYIVVKIVSLNFVLVKIFQPVSVCALLSIFDFFPVLYSEEKVLPYTVELSVIFLLVI